MFQTDVLDAAIRRRAQRLEEERSTVLNTAVEALRALGPGLGVTEAYLVGSVTQSGAWSEMSDVDVAMSGGEPLEVLLALEHAVGRAVDVIDLNAHPVPGMFRRRGLKVLG